MTYVQKVNTRTRWLQQRVNRVRQIQTQSWAALLRPAASVMRVSQDPMGALANRTLRRPRMTITREPASRDRVSSCTRERPWNRANIIVMSLVRSARDLNSALITALQSLSKNCALQTLMLRRVTTVAAMTSRALGRTFVRRSQCMASGACTGRSHRGAWVTNVCMVTIRGVGRLAPIPTGTLWRALAG